jgi:hypothetical protein
MNLRALVPALLLNVLALVGCGDDSGREVQPIERDGSCALGEPFTRTELFFGRDRPEGADVSDAEWATFVDTVVTPRFPDGLTVFDADGQYLPTDGELIKEDSKVLLLLHDGSAEISQDIEEIRERYKTQFAQESVLRIDTDVCVSF